MLVQELKDSSNKHFEATVALEEEVAKLKIKNEQLEKDLKRKSRKAQEILEKLNDYKKKQILDIQDN